MNDTRGHRLSYYIINGITLYRLCATVLLGYLIYRRDLDLFKWFLAFSFFTDSIDGFLARRFGVVSILGSRLDSVADDLTVVVALIGVFIFRFEFLASYYIYFLVLLVLYIVQVASALARYGKFTSFHTWSAKFSFLLQGIFLILIFFLPRPPVALFYVAFVSTAINLVEEIILVYMLPKWRADVRGIFWVRKRNE